MRSDEDGDGVVDRTLELVIGQKMVSERACRVW